MAGDKKVAIQPFIGRTLSLLVAVLIMFLPIFAVKSGDITAGGASLYDMLETFFSGAAKDLTTIQTLTVIVLYLAHLVAVANAVLYEICMLTDNEKLLNIAKIVSYALAGLAILGLILTIAALGDFEKLVNPNPLDPTKKEVLIGIAPIFAALGAIGSAVCSFVLKK